MWLLAIVAGIVVSIVAWWLAERCARAGRLALSRLFRFLQWSAGTAGVLDAIGLARHTITTGTLAWQTLVCFAGALAGLATCAVGYAAFRSLRSARHGRDGAKP